MPGAKSTKQQRSKTEAKNNDDDNNESDERDETMTMMATPPPPTTTANTGKTAPFKAQGDQQQPPPTDENERPTAAAAVAPRVRVPRGDLRVALAAIDAQLAADKAARGERRAAEGDESRVPSKKEAFLLRCMDETAESLKGQLEAATAADDGAEEALESFAARAFLARRPPSADDEDEDDGSLSSVDDEEEDIEFDDNEILDQDAYDRARQLRSQARGVAARVISLREETVGRALDVTRRNLSELMRIHGFSEDDAEGEANDENSDEAEEENETRDALPPMRHALNTLTASLQDVDAGLAERLESMKETIGTIDSSVEKYQRVSQGDQSALSQTEKALLASEAPLGGRADFLSEPSEDESESPHPDRDLARFLAGVL